MGTFLVWLFNMSPTGVDLWSKLFSGQSFDNSTFSMFQWKVLAVDTGNQVPRMPGVVNKCIVF